MLDLNDFEQSWPDPSWLAETELRRRLAQVSLIDYIRVMADDGGTTVALFDASGTLEGASGAPQPPTQTRNGAPGRGPTAQAIRLPLCVVLWAPTGSA